jgi:hypothetical protein
MSDMRLPRPAREDYLPVFEAEIALVPKHLDFPSMLVNQLDETATLITQFGEPGASLRYAPGKWTVRETVGHLSDCERILSYRMLRLLRGDATPLAGFDHNAYVPAADFESRSLQEVLDEFRAVRVATVALVASARLEAFQTRGQAGSGVITAAALAYLIAGHERHHQALLKTRYLPLLQPPIPSPGQARL